MVIKMEDINIINYFFENDIDIPNGMSVSVVDLPSELNKSFEIEKVKQEKRHANMKFTFSNPNYSGLGDKFDWALSCIVISYSYLLFRYYFAFLNLGYLQFFQNLSMIIRILLAQIL